MQKEEEKMKQRGPKEKIAYKCFHLFKYVIDQANVRFFIDFFTNLLSDIKPRKYLYCFVYYLLHLFSHIDSQLSQVYSHTIFIFFEYMNFLKTIHEEEFRNLNLSNLGNVLQRNFRTNRVRECIFKASGGTNFEKSSARRQP